MSKPKQLITIIKPWIGAVSVVILLHVTGLLSGISVITQTAVLKTGLLNASVIHDEKGEDFNYEFTIKDLNGRKIDFKQFKNKVVFLNLWATWCGPCRAEMPTIQALYDKLKDDQQIAFVILSIDKDKDLPKVGKYLKDRNFSFAGYMPSGYLTDQLNVPNIPTTFVISKTGKIISKEVGTTNFDTDRFYKFMKSEAAK